MHLSSVSVQCGIFNRWSPENLRCSFKSLLYAFRFCSLSRDNSGLSVEPTFSMHLFPYNALYVTVSASLYCPHLPIFA